MAWVALGVRFPRAPEGVLAPFWGGAPFGLVLGHFPKNGGRRLKTDLGLGPLRAARGGGGERGKASPFCSCFFGESPQFNGGRGGFLFGFWGTPQKGLGKRTLVAPRLGIEAALCPGASGSLSTGVGSR